uniref:Uncharacterized protein n=1 Tax=Lactuca sativa TaxID=4236 RepID=A0A9R1VP66_LACSA|nr:hypothetical protein LSAT_V11C400166850 [Lactuca sativa]
MEGIHLIDESVFRTWNHISFLLAIGLKRLIDDMSESIYCQEELKKLNQYLQMRANGIVHFPTKVSQLETDCSEKDVRMMLLEEEIATHKVDMAEKGAQIMELGELYALAKRDVLFHKDLSKQKVAEL